MGASIGYFSDDQPTDYPELNKCPDCETFFQTDCCPLCGKVCPEEFRAGNRKPVKPKKIKRGNRSGRVQFIPWYFSAWFIILMLIFFPIVGVILLWQSDYAKGWKIGGTVAAVGRYALAGILGTLVGLFVGLFDPQMSSFPHNMTQEQYVAACEQVDAEMLYRQPGLFVGDDITLQLKITAKGVDQSDVDIYDRQVWYVCTADVGDRKLQFLVYDMRGDHAVNLAVGDTVTVYGAGNGNSRIYDTEVGTVTAPAILMYFAVLESGT